MEIPTEHGTALLYYDATSDPASPGWVLRYHTADQEHLDEILPAANHNDMDGAVADAVAFLDRQGIGVDGALLLALVGVAARAVVAAAAQRDILIRAAMRSEARRADIARAAGVSEARLYQIRDGRR